MKATFQNSIFDIVMSCENLIGRSSKFCDAMLLVGGYSESPYLRSTLREKLGSRGIQIVSIEGQSAQPHGLARLLTTINRRHEEGANPMSA